MSDTFSKTVWKGAEAIKQIAEEAPHKNLAVAAVELSSELHGFRSGPLPIIAESGENAVSPQLIEKMEAFIAEVKQVSHKKRTSPKYDQPVFQCYADFEKCKESGTSIFLCGLMLALCYVERVIHLKFIAIRKRQYA